MDDGLPRVLLLWAIKRNQPEMLECLVGEFGFQFRWIFYDLREIFEILFHIIDRMSDEFGVWRSTKYDPERYMRESRRVQRKYRARCCYKEKQKMLTTVIKLGMPIDLLCPQIDVELDKAVLKQAQAKGMEIPDDKMVRDFYFSLSRPERKARKHIHAACMEYNDIRKKDDCISLIDFYEYVQAMWKDQPTVQEARLPEFEGLDPRWKKFETMGEDAFTPWWLRNIGDDDDFSDEADY
jgi:hypothetical protein